MAEDEIYQPNLRKDSPFANLKRGITETVTNTVDYRRGIAQHRKDIEPLRDMQVIPPPPNFEFHIPFDMPVVVMLYDMEDPNGKAMAANRIDPKQRTYYSASEENKTTIANRIGTHRSESVITVGVRFKTPLEGEPILDSQDFQDIAETLEAHGYDGSKVAVVPLRTIQAEAGGKKAVQAAYGNDIGDLLWQTQQKIKTDPANKGDHLENFYAILKTQLKDLDEVLTPDHSSQNIDSDRLRFAQGQTAYNFAEDFIDWYKDQQDSILFDPAKPDSPIHIQDMPVRIGGTITKISFDDSAQSFHGRHGPSLMMTRPAFLPLSGFPEKERIVLAGYTDSVGRQVGRTIYERTITLRRGNTFVVEREIDTARSNEIVLQEMKKILSGKIISESK